MALRPLCPRVRRAATALWAAGAVLAGATGAVSAADGEVGFAVVYFAACVGLLTLARTTSRAIRLAERVTLVGLASQIPGTAGAAWALLHGSDHNPKAEHLRDLGIDYRTALVANVAYSAIASAVFVWAVLDARTRRQTENP